MNKTKQHIFLIVLCSFMAIGLLYAENTEHSGSPMNTKISLSIKDGNIPAILDSITSNYQIHFSYNSELINCQQKITISFYAEPLKDILHKLFVDKDILFDCFGEQVIIYKECKQNSQIPKNFNTKYQTISGKIIDKKTRQPIPFAHIYTRKDGSGTISNVDGDFEIKIPVKEKDDMLVVSYIGYDEYTVKIDKLHEDCIIALNGSSLKIQEVTVIPFHPKQIISKAVSMIPKNYSTKPQVYKAFFREYNKMNDEYISLSEAVLDIYKAPYKVTSVPDVAVIKKGRKNSTEPTNSEINFKVQGGIYYCLKLDVVKSLASFLNENFFDVYEYKLTDIISHSGSYIYEISFDQIDEVDRPYYKGKIFIDANSLAITGVEFFLSDKQIEMADQLYVRKKPVKYKVKPISAHYRVNYIEKKGRWYLNNIKSELVVDVTKRNGEFQALYTSTSEMLITKRESKEIASFTRKGVQKSTDILLEQINNYDKTFWGVENIIKPDQTIQQAYSNLISNDNYVVTTIKSIE